MLHSARYAIILFVTIVTVFQAKLAAHAAAIFDIDSKACGTKEPENIEIVENNFRTFLMSVKSESRRRLSGLNPDIISSQAGNHTPVVVDTVFHVIYSNVTLDSNVSDSMIHEQMDIMNKEFDGHFQFDLKKINRVNNETWFLADMTNIGDEMKIELREGNVSVLNIFTSGLNVNLRGYATFPWEYSTKPKLDGVVVRYNTLPGSKLPPYNLGKTLPHEVGHWLGLYHIFRGGCSIENDYVDDTPASIERPSQDCPDAIDSCTGEYFPGLDLVHNLMDYNTHACRTGGFTPGQFERMRNHWLLYRSLNNSTE